MSLWGGAPAHAGADTIVLDQLRASDDRLHRELVAAGIACARAGDCLRPRDGDAAILEGSRWGRAV